MEVNTRIRAGRPAFWAAALAGLWLTWACAACSPNEASETESERELALRSLRCDNVRAIDADVYFYDEMEGFDCILQDGSTLIFRQYRNPDSVGQVLQDWQPVLSQSRPVTWGTDWFAIGPVKQVEQVSNALPGSVEPTTETPSALPLSPWADEMTSCVRFVSSTLTDFAVSPEMYMSEIASLDKIYPGMRMFIESQLPPSRASRLKELFDSDSLGFQAELAESGLEAHEFCSARLASPDS